MSKNEKSGVFPILVSQKNNHRRSGGENCGENAQRTQHTHGKQNTEKKHGPNTTWNATNRFQHCCYKGKKNSDFRKNSPISHCENLAQSCNQEFQIVPWRDTPGHNLKFLVTRSCKISDCEQISQSEFSEHAKFAQAWTCPPPFSKIIPSPLGEGAGAQVVRLRRRLPPPGIFCSNTFKTLCSAVCKLFYQVSGRGAVR